MVCYFTGGEVLGNSERGGEKAGVVGEGEGRETSLLNASPCSNSLKSRTWGKSTSDVDVRSLQTTNVDLSFFFC